jgi:hypothetical protein
MFPQRNLTNRIPILRVGAPHRITSRRLRKNQTLPHKKPRPKSGLLGSLKSIFTTQLKTYLPSSQLEDHW